MGRRATLICAVICAFACLGFVGCRKSPVNYVIPPEEASRANPIVATPDAIAAGRKAYDGTDCALCHGKSGDGKGALSQDMKYKTHDWRDPAALRNFSDGELFYILDKGKGMMPGYEERQTAGELWQMVDYLRSLATH